MYYQTIVLILLSYDSKIVLVMYMTKRIVISGSRNYNNYEEAKRYIDICINRIKSEYNLIFVSGVCRGADLLGERYAEENGYSIERYPAEWEKFGKKAGPLRNRKMAQIGDYFICFWDGKSAGTKSMIDFATALKKPIRIIKIEN